MKRPHHACNVVRFICTSQIDKEQGEPSFYQVLSYSARDAYVIVMVHAEFLHCFDAVRTSIVVPFDDDATCLLRVPLDMIAQWYDEEEAEHIAECASIDQHLLACAR